MRFIHDWAVENNKLVKLFQSADSVEMFRAVTDWPEEMLQG